MSGALSAKEGCGLEAEISHVAGFGLCPKNNGEDIE